MHARTPPAPNAKLLLSHPSYPIDYCYYYIRIDLRSIAVPALPIRRADAACCIGFCTARKSGIALNYRLLLACMHNASFIDQGHCVIVIKHVRARSACIRRTRRQRDALPRSARQTRHERIRDSRERERERQRERE